MCVAYPAGWYVFQETGIVIANSLLAIPAYVVFGIGLYRNRISLFRQDVMFTFLYVATAALAWGLSRPLLLVVGIESPF